MNDSLLLLNYTRRGISRIGAIAALATLFAASLLAQGGETVLGVNPFGFQCGMTAEQVVDLVGKDAVTEAPDDVPAALRERGFRSLRTAMAPQPYPAFGSYSLMVSPEQGVAEIIARDFNPRGLGASVHSTYIDIRAAVTKVYGAAETFDLHTAVGGLSWDAFWSLTPALPNRIHTIGLRAEQADGISIMGAAPSNYKSNLASKDSLSLSYECSGFEGDVASRKAAVISMSGGCDASRIPHDSSNRDYSTPSSRLVGRWASRNPLSAGITCRYYGPIDKETGTGLYVTWILKALDKKTGKRSLITPGSGPPPQAVSWEAVKTQYEVVQEVPWGDSVTIRIPSEASTHIPSMPQFGTETHHIECAGMSDERHYLLVDTQRYVDGKNTACSEGNPDWHDDFSHVLATLNQDPKGNPGKWKTATSVSSFDDSKTVVLSLLAENQISGWPGTRTTPALILRCKEGKTEAYIAAGLQAKLEFVDGKSLDSASMRGRYDQDDPIHFLMPKSTDGKSFFFLWPTGEIARMWSHSSLVLEFTPFNSNPVEMRFDLSGLSSAVPPLRHACGW